MVLDRVGGLMRRHAYTLAVLIEVIVYTYTFSAILIDRFYNLAFAEDIGETIQAVYTTAFHGRLLEQAFSAGLYVNLGYAERISYLTAHFSPILFLLVPFYYLIPKVETLLVLKALITSLSVIPAYLLAKARLGKKLGLLAAILYLLHPALHASTLANWPPNTFLPLFLLLTIYFRWKSIWRAFWLSLVLTLMVHEFAGLLVAAYVFTEFLVTRKLSRRDAITFAVSVAWSISAWLFINAMCPRIATYTLSIPEILSRFVDPAFLMHAIGFAVYALAPYAFAPIKSWYILSLGPYVLWAISFKYFDISSIGWHNGYYYLAPLYVAFVDGLSKATLRTIYKIAVPVAMVTTLILSPVSPLTLLKGAGPAYSDTPYSPEHIEAINEVLNLIPRDAVVVAQSPISIRLADRIGTYVYMPRDTLPEYILVDFKNVLFRTHKFDEIVNRALNEGYGVYAFNDGVLLLKKGYRGEPVLLKPMSEVVLMPQPPTIWMWRPDTPHPKVLDPSSDNKIVIKCQVNGVCWYGPYMPLFQGTYEIVIKLRVEGEFSEDDIVLIVNVMDVSKRRVFVSIPVHGKDVKRGEYVDISATFSLDNIYARVEFIGIKVNSDVVVYLSDMRLRHVSLEKPKTYSVMLYSFLFQPLHGEKENSYIVHKLKHGEGTFFFGPYISLSRGSYKATFWIKVVSTPDLSSNRPLLILDVARISNESIEVLAEKVLTIRDVELGKWQPVPLQFTLDEPSSLVEFRCRYIVADAEVYFLKVDIEGNLSE